ncbi:hypothetical protein BDR05DRAFT_945376 [Suillus weaverae]|nr:hypothetical protein BDR05DRAFT_945376 [Suillus weaverae]
MYHGTIIGMGPHGIARPYWYIVTFGCPSEMETRLHQQHTHIFPYQSIQEFRVPTPKYKVSSSESQVPSPELRSSGFGAHNSEFNTLTWILSPELQSSGFGVRGIGDPELGIQNKRPNPESRNSELGTPVSGTQYSGQSIELRVTNFGTRDSGVRDLIFRTKYRAPNYELRTPNPEFRSSGLGTWDSELDTLYLGVGMRNS